MPKIPKRTQEEVIEIFEKLDRNYDQTIDEDEFVKGMKQVFNVTEKDNIFMCGFFLVAMFKLSDESGLFKLKDGILDLKEITHLLDCVPNPLEEDPLTNIGITLFNVLDRNHSGNINKREFKKYAVATRMPEHVIERKMKEIDTDGNGKISLNEFLTWMKETASQN